MSEVDNVKAIGLKLAATYVDYDNPVVVGIAQKDGQAPSLILYFQRRPKQFKFSDLPATFEGVGVQYKIMGKVKPAGS